MGHLSHISRNINIEQDSPTPGLYRG